MDQAARPDQTGPTATQTGPTWLSIPEAALALGLSEKAVRSRIKRKTLITRHDAAGRIQVRIGSDSESDQNRPLADHADLLTELRARLADKDGELRERLADKDAEIARLTSIIERRDREAERMQVLLQAEQQQVKLLTDQRQNPPDPPKSRWRRWFGR